MATNNLYQILGPREQELMEYFWEHGRSNSTEVYAYMQRPVTTVNTQIERLVEKGLLIKEKNQRKRDGYFYTPRLSKEELVIEAVQMLLLDLKASPSERKHLAQAIVR
jgi:predicted transcriptional regulator